MIVFALVVGPWWLTQSPQENLTAEQELKAKNDVRTTLVQVLAGLAVACGVVVTYSTYRQNQHEQDRTYEQRQEELRQRQEEQNRTYERELYAEAVEHLGHDKAPVRLGALYSLESLAQDRPERRPTVVDVFCAYLRMPYTPPPEANPTGKQEATQESTAIPPSTQDAAQELQVRQTAQRLLATHVRLPPNTSAADAQKRRSSPHDTFWPGISVDLTGATLVKLDLRNASVVRAIFDKAKFTGDAQFQGATFTGDALFNAATFVGDQARFDGATFTGDASFNWATFTGSTSFNQTTFTRDALFNVATFVDQARFDGATFTGDAMFSNATFDDEVVWFVSATFIGDAWFAGARFNGAGPLASTRFFGATFARDARFDEARFAGAALFDDVRIAGEHASFLGAEFAGRASFQRVIFAGNVLFHEATFTGDALFQEARFPGDVRFSSATFGVAWFTGATFTGSTWFEQARFTGLAGFDGATFAGDATFDGATFSSIAFYGAKVLNLDNASFRWLWPHGWTVRPDPADPTRGELTRENNTSSDPS